MAVGWIQPRFGWIRHGFGWLWDGFSTDGCRQDICRFHGLMQCEFVVTVCSCGTICIGCGREHVGRFFGGSTAAKLVGKWQASK